MRRSEIWVNVRGYNGDYQISNFGRVKSLKRTNELIMSGVDNGFGYYRVCMSINGTCKMHAIHILVATHFICNVKNKPEVNHIDGNKTNNHVDNLEWCTRSENIQHAFDTGLRVGYSGSKNGRAKLKRDDVLQIRSLSSHGWFTISQIADAYNISNTQIRAIINKKAWSHV